MVAPSSSKALSLTCHQNYSCATNPTIQTAGKAVARIVMTRGGSSFVCSGALLNDRGSTGSPYFATANHCLASAEEASSIEFNWFYEQPCNGTTAPLSRAFGSQLLFTDAGVDFTLL